MARTNAHFLSSECFFFLTLDAIDILCLGYLNLSVNEIMFKIHKQSFTGLEFYFIGSEIRMK